MPVCVAQTVQKVAVRGATICHDGYLVSADCHRMPLAAQLLATYAWNGPRATRWWMSWSAGRGGAACRGKCLGWPSRQAPLAGALSPWLKYFVLEWLQRDFGGPWRSPGKPCRGGLRLPVHKFGILRYPYFS